MVRGEGGGGGGGGLGAGRGSSRAKRQRAQVVERPGRHNPSSACTRVL